MAADHCSYEELAQQRRGSEEYREGHAEARRAFLIGHAVRERRLELGLSQVELATRAGMTQPALSRLEAGGVVPTIPLLERISIALDADLIVEIAPQAACNPTPTSPDSSTFDSAEKRALPPARAYAVPTRLVTPSQARTACNPLTW